MRIIIENEPVKIQNFVEYLTENFTEKGKTYEFEIHIEDKYDTKALENREESLNNKILVSYSEGYEIVNSNLIDNLEAFKDTVNKLLDTDVTKDFTKENLSGHFTHYKICFVENKNKHQFNFSYINFQV